MAGRKQQTEKLSDRIYRIDKIEESYELQVTSLKGTRRQALDVQLAHPGEAEKQILWIL